MILYHFVDLARFFGVVTTTKANSQFINAHILFDLNSNNENQLIKFMDSIESLRKAGEPMIVTLKDLDVIENEFWGIEGGGKVALTVILLTLVFQRSSLIKFLLVQFPQQKGKTSLKMISSQTQMCRKSQICFHLVETLCLIFLH